jgi:glycosyltransferase involved in cell wall biosynthesis
MEPKEKREKKKTDFGPTEKQKRRKPDMTQSFQTGAASVYESGPALRADDCRPEAGPIENRGDELRDRPLISVLMPVRNIEERWLRRSIGSVMAQSYPCWELCVADDASTEPHIRDVLLEYRRADARVRVVTREEPGGIAASLNSALNIANGEFCAILDQGDELAPDALHEAALLFNRVPQADMIYSDEDRIDENGNRHSPYFKPGWSPDLLLGQMYTRHFSIYRTQLARAVGGFRTEYDGGHDWDFALRLTERTNRIYHIPKVLYHARTNLSLSLWYPDAEARMQDASFRAVCDALLRREEHGHVEPVPGKAGRFLVRYKAVGEPPVSVIILTRDRSDLLDPCLASIFDKTTYPNFEVIVVDNGSTQGETFDLFRKWLDREPDRFRVIRIDIPYNWSALNNEAVRHARGELILLLNNDTEVITPHWLEEMAGQAVRPSIGAVGAKLLYPDFTIQHAGVLLGDGCFSRHNGHLCPRYHEGYFDQLLSVANYAAVTGACLMVRKAVFEEVGGINESIPVAYNDIDFCLKLLQRGYFNVMLPHVELFHRECSTRGYDDTPEKRERARREEMEILSQWNDVNRFDPFYNANLQRRKEKSMPANAPSANASPGIESPANVSLPNSPQENPAACAGAAGTETRNSGETELSVSNRAAAPRRRDGPLKSRFAGRRKSAKKVRKRRKKSAKKSRRTKRAGGKSPTLVRTARKRRSGKSAKKRLKARVA